MTRPSVEVSSRTSIDENISAPMPKAIVQKKFTKLQLNPNAPLFSNNHGGNPRLHEQANQPGFYYPQQQNENFNHQNPANNYFQPHNGRPTNGNNYLNAPLFPGFGMSSEDSNSEFPPMTETNNAMPPGLFNYFSQPSEQPVEDQSSQSVYSQAGNKNSRSLYIETKTQPQQDSQSFIKEEDEPVETPEVPKKMSNEFNALIPDRSKSKGQNNLYTAVLSGKFKAESIINSPALNKIRNQYFSEISSGVNTPDANTPLYSSTMRPSFAEPEEPSTPLTEDMIENFSLEDYQGRLVEFAKSYNGSRFATRTGLR
ncbi:MAG: hypothetical protein EOP48_26095, partial [Sphingobacteriales bacterium]